MKKIKAWAVFDKHGYMLRRTITCLRKYTIELFNKQFTEDFPEAYLRYNYRIRRIKIEVEE